jgi:excisionase family DNA binding protein
VASSTRRRRREAEERYTIAEASALTGLSKRALARRIERGRLPADKVGRLRTIAARDLAEAGLLDLATGRAPAWRGERIPAEVVAKEVVQTLVRQGIELHELKLAFDALGEESRRDDGELRASLERARLEREELREALRDAEARIAELRRRIDRMPAS